MYEKELNIPTGNILKQTKIESKQKKSEDIDTTWYDEIDIDGNIISKYIVKDATSIYPPYKRYVEYEKKDLWGTLLEDKRLSI